MNFEVYKNLGGNSNVKEYAIGGDIIHVRFKDNSVYKYSLISHPNLIELAKNGRGLNSYIMRKAKKDYL